MTNILFSSTNCTTRILIIFFPHISTALHPTRVGAKYSTCTWYLYLSTNLSVLGVLEYLVCGNIKVLVLVLDQQVLGT